MEKAEDVNIAENVNIADSSSVAFEKNLLTVAEGGGIVYAGKLLLSLSRLITVFILARLLSAEQYGLYNIAISTATVAMGIALLGLDDALVRYIAIFNSRQDKDSLLRALEASVGIATLLSTLTGTVLFALAYPIAERVFNKPQLAPILQLTSVIVPFMVLSEVFAGASRGLKKMHYMVIAQNIAQPVIRLILIVILSLVGMTPGWAILSYGLASGASSILFLFYLNKHLPPKKPVGVRRRDVQTLLGFSLPLWLSDLMINFRDNIQTILLGSLSTIANVGIYSIVSQVNMIGQMLLGSIIASAKPMIAELHDRGDDPQLSRLYQTTTKWLLMINLPVFLVMVLFPKQILSIFGNSFINGAGALVVLAFANLVNIGTGMCGAIIEMTGYTKLKLVNTFVRLITSVSFNFLLIPIWGIIGAAVAALLVEIIVNFLILFQIWFLFRMFPYNKHFFNLLVAGIAAFAATLIVNHFLPNQENLLYFLIGLAVMFGVYVGVSLVLGLAPEDRLLLSRLQKKVSSLVG